MPAGGIAGGIPKLILLDRISIGIGRIYQEVERVDISRMSSGESAAHGWRAVDGRANHEGRPRVGIGGAPARSVIGPDLQTVIDRTRHEHGLAELRRGDLDHAAGGL